MKNCHFSGLFQNYFENQRTTNSLFFEEKNIRIKELWFPVVSKTLQLGPEEMTGTI
jgi:hypothetical protein